MCIRDSTLRFRRSKPREVAVDDSAYVRLRPPVGDAARPGAPALRTTSEPRGARAERHIRSPPSVEQGAAELADLLGRAFEPAPQPADRNYCGERARTGAEMGISGALAGAPSGHPARRRRDDVHDSKPERRRGVERRHGQTDLDLL